MEGENLAPIPNVDEDVDFCNMKFDKVLSLAGHDLPLNDSKEEETSGLKVMRNPTTYVINFGFRERRAKVIYGLFLKGWR